MVQIMGKEKYKMVSALLKDTAKAVVRNEEEWERFLDSACGQYKYNFEDQLLIYAQRPDTTACASMELWNRKMFCWVNKGAKGIALFDHEDDRKQRLRYVFDVSDVHAARRIGRLPKLWEMKEEHKEAVLERLEKRYGKTEETKSFTERIVEISARIAAESTEEMEQNFQYAVAGSYLEELEEYSRHVMLRDTLADSLAYMVLKRCGISQEEIEEEVAFPHIHEFNTVQSLSELGGNLSQHAKEVLIEIGKALRDYDREKKGTISKTKEKEIEKSYDVVYN